jgi:regulator of protease activity HflC (stomatin/prohibitin superfamily)
MTDPSQPPNPARSQPAAGPPPTPTTRWQRFRAWLRRRELMLITAVLFLLLAIVYLAPNIFIFIHAGERGVLWRRFGSGVVTDHYYREGTTIIWPWNTMTIYNTRIQVESRTFDALSSDGLTIQVETSVRYRPIKETLGLLHEHVGPNYVEVVLLPEVAAAVRAIVASYRQDDLYTRDRLKLQQEILHYLQTQTDDRWIKVDDVQVRSVVLPKHIQDAIEAKLAAEQKAKEYVFILQAEAREAERKAIEARGIRAFQETVTAGISDAYLRWKGIDATLKLAESPNAKVVVIGSGPNGLPIILNTETTPAGIGTRVGPPPP